MVTEHYPNILDRSKEAFDALSSDDGRLPVFVSSHNAASELDGLACLLEGRPEEKMFELARIEYQHALYAVAFAQYRQAHVSLRLFLELSLCSVLFSAHEIDSRRWLMGAKDTNWRSIICNENGVFSKNFVGPFFDEMKEHSGQYRAMAEKLYRECSEFVHGNRQSYEGIDAKFDFNADVFDCWTDRADTAGLCVKFAFLSRYLPHITEDKRASVESIALDDFGALAAIQSLFSETKE